MLSRHRQCVMRQILCLGNQFNQRIPRTSLDSVVLQFSIGARYVTNNRSTELSEHLSDYTHDKKKKQLSKQQLNSFTQTDDEDQGGVIQTDDSLEAERDWNGVLANIINPSPEDVRPHPDADKEVEMMKRATEDISKQAKLQADKTKQLDPDIANTDWADSEKRVEIQTQLGQKPRATFHPRPDRILIPVEGTVLDYCGMLQMSSDKIQAMLIKMGLTDISRTTVINQEIGLLLAREAKIPEILFEKPFEDLVRRRPTMEEKMNLPFRPPIICVMGHVDHGKTTLIDYLRNSNRAAGEAGGITQSIGAFPVPLPDGTTFDKFTMIDTPGHAAFTAMRERGAQVVDAVILVVSASDGVENQTKESVGIIRKWGVPFVVALNKCDKEGADPEKVREELLLIGVSEEEVDMCEISAKTGLGMGDMLIATELVSEAANPRAEAVGRAEIVVLEATQSKKDGTIISAIVQAGCLKLNSYAMLGEDYARVARLSDAHGNELQDAGPSTPVRFKANFKHLPAGGTELITAEDLEFAKQVAKYRRKKKQKQIWERDMLNLTKEEHMNQRELKLRVKTNVMMSQISENLDENLVDAEEEDVEEEKITRRTLKKRMKAKNEEGSVSKISLLMDRDLDEIPDEELIFKIKGAKVADWYRASPELKQRRRDALQREARGKLEASNLIHVLVKADGTGPIEAVTEFVKQIKVPNDELEINVLPLDVGAITDQDIFEFDHPRTVMLGFNVSGPRDPDLNHLTIITSEIIFQVIEQLIAHLETLMKPDWHYHVLGRARVQKMFTINKRSKNERRVCGCFVETGKVTKGKYFRVERDGVEIHTQGPLKTLKHFKEDTEEITMGQECGIGLDFDLCVEGDRIECIEWQSIKRRIPLPEVGLREDLQRSLFEGKEYVPPPRHDNAFQLNLHTEDKYLLN